MCVTTKKDALHLILDGVTDEVVITSTGMISREVYEMKDRDRNFYMQGSMGMALAIGLGIAYARKDLNVIVISGDGAALMSLGTLVLHKQLVAQGMTNLKHFILDNNCHASTGGQPTCSDFTSFKWIGPQKYTMVIEITKEKGDAPRIPMKCKAITERFKHAIIRKR